MIGCTAVCAAIVGAFVFQEYKKVESPLPVLAPMPLVVKADENLPDNYFRITENEIAVIDGTKEKLKHWINHPSTAYKLDSNGMIIYFSSVPGEYHFFASESPIFSYKVVVTGKIPIDPVVPINPVNPTVPFLTDRLCVLIVEETEDRKTLARNYPEKVNAITSSKVHRYIKEQGGDFALVDPDSPLENENEWVVEAMKVKRGKLPWLIVSNGKTRASEAVIDLDSLLAIIKKVGKP